jgi:hypothetical protein
MPYRLNKDRDTAGLSSALRSKRANRGTGSSPKMRERFNWTRFRYYQATKAFRHDAFHWLSNKPLDRSHR